MKTEPEVRVSAFLHKLKPIGNRVVIKVEEISKMTAGGIMLPEKMADAQRPARGVVIAAGPDCTEVAEEDYVVFMMYAGSHVESADEQERREHEEGKHVFRIVREREIFGVWKKGDWDWVEVERPEPAGD